MFVFAAKELFLNLLPLYLKYFTWQLCERDTPRKSLSHMGSLPRIDRLRKIINDENPKTPVGDAPNFFKRPKTKRRKKKVKIVLENNKRREQLKLLCGVFGYKIIESLENPMHIELSLDMVKIAHIVNKDVSSILHNSEHQSISEQENEIQSDVVRKITVWIDGILEESSHKLFLENLKDIEEEEGPVLDLLDEVFYKASVIFESNYEGNYSGDHAEKYDNESVYHNDILQQLIDKEFEDSLNDTSSKFPEHYIDGDDASKGDERSEEREWIKDTIFNAMDVMINVNAVNDKTVDNEKLQSTDLKDIDLEDLKDYINVILIQIIEEAYAQYVDKINGLKHKHVNKSNDDSPNNSDDSDAEFAKKFKRTKDSLVIRSTLDLVSKSQMNFDNTVNCSEEDNISLESLDDGNKKVKFNNNDIDNSMELTKTMASHLNSENYLPILKTKSVTIHNEKTPKTIYVSNPTPYLLSEADESWPESTSFHNTKSLLKVSKSVLSLGELLEREEEILPQSVRDSVEILNHLLSGYSEVATENNVSILNNKDDRNTKRILENVDETKDESNRNKHNMILEEASKIRARESKADNVLSANNSVTNEEGRLKSSLLLPDKIITPVQTSIQKTKLFTVEKLPNINIVKEVCNEDTKVIARSKNTQHSPDLLNKRTQTDIETSRNVEKTIFETGSNTTEENQEWTKSLDNIVVNLETWLYWIRNITADVERLLENECGGVKCYKLHNKLNLDSKYCIQQSKDLHKRLVKTCCKNNNVKVMPYKCYCNKNIQS